MKAYSFCPLDAHEWKARHPKLPFPQQNDDEDEDDDDGPDSIEKTRSFLGKGSFGMVRRMIKDGNMVAVKFVSLEGAEADQVKNEADIV